MIKNILTKLILFLLVILNTNNVYSQELYNIKIDNRPSDLEYAELSLHVYDGKKIKVGKIVNIENNKWRVIQVRNGKNSYFGAIYVNDKTKEMVLSHRGTDSFGAVRDDIEGVIFGRLTLQYEECYNFVRSAVKLAKEKNYHLSITGHSLGALLAELSTYYCHDKFDYRSVNAVTFESPGARDIIENKLLPNLKDNSIKIDDLDITEYVSYPNMINTSRLHIGTLYQLYPMMGNLGWVPGWYTKQAHSMENIVTIFREHKIEESRVLIRDWPLGSEKKRYFNYAMFAEGKYNIEDLNKNHEFELYYKGHYSAETQYNLKNQIDIRHFEFSLRSFLLEFFNKHSSLFITDDHRKVLAEYWHKRGVPLDLANLLSNYRIDHYGEKKIVTVLSGDDAKSFRKKISIILSKNLSSIQNLLFEPLSIQKNEKGNLTVIKGDVIQANTYIENFIYNGNQTASKDKEEKNQNENWDFTSYYMPIKNNIFIGRKKELQQIEENFGKSNIGVELQSIVGTEGVGKTTLAIEYIYASIDNKKYDRILWIPNAEGSDDIDNYYRNFARKMAIKNVQQMDPIRLRYFVHNKLLRDYNVRNLLIVLDDVDDKKYINDYISEINAVLASACKIDVLITSKNQIWDNNKILLDVFTPKEAHDFILNYLPKENLQDVEELAKTFYYYPLSISQAVAYINDHTSIKEYLFLYKNKPIEYMKKDKDEISGETETVWKTLAVSADSLSKNAQDMLYKSAYLKADYIPFALFDNFCIENDNQDAHDNHVLCIENRLKSVNELKKNSFITLINDNKAFKIHDFLQEIIRLKLGKDDKFVKILLNKAEECVDNFDKNNESSRNIVECWIPHVPVIKKYINEELDIASLLYKYSRAAIQLKEYDYFRSFVDESFLIQAKYYKNSAPEKAIEALGRLADIKSNLGNYSAAAKILHKIISLQKKSYSKESYIKIIDTMFNCAWTENSMGNYGIALDLFQECADLYSKYYNNENEIKKATFFHGLGHTNAKLGNNDEALKFAEQALAIAEKNYGINHAITAEYMRLMALIETNKANYGEAKKLLKEVLLIESKVYEEENLQISYSLEDLAYVEYKLTNYTEAKNSYKHSLRIKEKIYNSKIHMALIENIFGLIIMEEYLGNYDEAIELFKQLQEIYKSYGSKKIKTTSTISGMNINMDKRNSSYHKQASKLMDQIMEQDHPLAVKYRERAKLNQK